MSFCLSVDACVFQLSIQSTDDDGEDEYSIQQHITTMQQMHKSNGDVTDRMAKTYSHRRELIISGAKLGDVLQMYPALKDETQVYS